MIRRAAAWLLCLSLALLCLLPAAAPAESGPRVIRVGWYETPFNHKDTLGRRTGYAYEYQRKIAAYTGWKYEYVEGSWAELLQMLEDGRIDLMSDVSFTEERTEYMYFSNLPMGSEMYYLFVTPDNREISADDYSTLNGKKVGITKSSVQLGFFLEWEQARGIETELVELTCSEEESMKMLTAGEIDAFVTLDTYGDPDVNVPLWKIGASDFYFAVSRTRPDLVPELDQAMNRIQDENKYYNEQLSIKYLRNSSANYYLSAEEQDWLAAHGPIRIGYQDNYLAFCASDPETGELTGALKDYLDFASGVLENADLSFVAVPYPTAAAAMEALENGEIDCMFPSNLTDYDGEQAGVVMSPPMMSTEMDAADGVGFDRTMTGSGAVAQYHEPLKSLYNDVTTCPENLILWFHHLPWDYEMKSGRTLWDELCLTFQSGINDAKSFVATWNSVEQYVDALRFADIKAKLERQAKDAIWWRDATIQYFQQFSGMNLPDGCQPFQQKLEKLMKYRIGITNYENPKIETLPEYKLD